MTFLFPAFLYAAGAVSLAVVALHFLVTQQPQSEDLPTVRFVPDVPIQSTSLTIKPSDLLLLLLRILLIMLIGAAFAQPQFKPKHQKIARVVAIDASRDVGNMAELVDSARRYTEGARAVILFDSTAHEVPPETTKDSLQALASRPRSVRRGALSPALIASLRAASRARTGADSLELVVISPFVNEERDAATDAIRALWPGRIRTVPVSAVADSSIMASTSVRQVRVQWADSANEAATGASIWAARPKPDTLGAIRVGNSVLIAQFVRRWRLAIPLDTTTRVVARWVDGEPAAVERIANGVCTRAFAFTLPTAGDAILRPDFARVAQEVNAPCGVRHDVTPFTGEMLRTFQGPAHLASAANVKPPVRRTTPIVPWLLAGALFLAVLELLVRRLGRKSHTDDTDVSPAKRSPREPEIGSAA